MKLKSMTATFGGLQEAHLEFGDGLNLIHGPNEAGKSTWCAFWKAMLYGIDTRERDKAGRLADKNRYDPWNNALMTGEMRLEWEGHDITIRRSSDRSAPFCNFSATYTGTGEPVGFLTAQNCGEMLTGVSKEVFERSAFIGGDLAVASTPDLEKRIASIVSSGQEDVSFSQVEGRLKDWMNRRRVNRSVGLIPKLEKELAQVSRELEALSSHAGEVARLEGEYSDLTRQLSAWEEESGLHSRLARRELDDRFARAQADLDRAVDQLHRLERESARFGALPSKEKLKRAQGELQYLKVLDEEIQSAQAALTQAEDAYVQAQRSIQDSRFTGMTPDEASERAQNDLAQYRDCMETARSKAFAVRLFPIGGAVLAVVYLALRFVLGDSLLLPDFLVAVAALLAGGLLGVLFHRKAGSWRARAEQLLDRWSADSPEDLARQMEEYRRRCQKTELAASQLKAIRGALNDKLARKENDVTDLMSFVHTFAPEVTALFGCSAALSRALNLDYEQSAARDRVEQCALRRDDLAAQGGRLPEGGSPEAPAHSREECQQALEQLTRSSEALKAELDQARGTLSALGDPAALAARKEQLEEELARREGEYSAAESALNTLKTVYSQLQSRFSPELNRLASRYMSRLTGEQYANLALDRQLGGEVTPTGAAFSRSALYLSRGTLDQLYLSVRLAVCGLCLPQHPPIVLDDALVAFDDHRMKLALELLLELAQNQQLLVFTCQNREGEALAGKPVTRLELG